MKYRNQNKQLKNIHMIIMYMHMHRSRTYTLVKINVRTQKYKSILNMGVSNN